MVEQRSSTDRINLLVNVAEMYYLDGKTQDEIAQAVGVTRSMISRMLTEARAKGIIEVRIHRPLQFDDALGSALTQYFGLKNACVVDLGHSGERQLLKHLGAAGAPLVTGYLNPKTVLGIAWGTSVSAVVDQIDVEEPVPVKIVQLVGALGAQLNEYNGHGLVQRLVQKLGGEGYFINAPFLCPTAETAQALLKTPGVVETVEMAAQVNLALVGVGSILPEYSSFYLAGYVPIEELEALRRDGAVGDVCGLNFDIHGREICGHFSERLITIQREQLLEIPLRVGVAGGSGKVDALLGALRGKYINVLITDSATARRILDHEGLLNSKRDINE